MNRSPSTLLLTGTFILLLIGSCRKNPEEPVPPAPDGGGGTQLGQVSGEVVLPDGSSINYDDLEVLSTIGLGGVNTDGNYGVETMSGQYGTMVVLDAMDNVVLLGYTYPGQPDATISARSTALALVMNTVAALQLTDAGKQALVAAVLNDPLLQALENEVAQAVAAGNYITDENNTTLIAALAALFDSASGRSGFCPDPPVVLNRGGRNIGMVNMSSASYVAGVYLEDTRVQRIDLGGVRYFQGSISDVVNGEGTIAGDPTLHQYMLQGDGDFTIRMHNGAPTAASTWQEKDEALRLNIKDGMLELVSLTGVPLPGGACSAALVNRAGSIVNDVVNMPTLNTASDFAAYTMDLSSTLMDGSVTIFQACATPDQQQNAGIAGRFLRAIGRVLNPIRVAQTVIGTMNLSMRALHIFACEASMDTCFTAQGTSVMTCEGGCQGETTVTDIDGNTYPVVSIGNQCWMAANLKTTRYRDGSTIPNVTDNTAWTQLNSGAWCNYNNSPGSDATYGKLYNWYAAANPNICPQGWHVPTDAEWQQLESALGMPGSELGLTGYRGTAQNVGGKMKTTTLWNPPNTGATNESGFSGLPGGLRYSYSGSFNILGDFGGWWSASEGGAEGAWYRLLLYDSAGIGRHNNYKRDGFCVRCVRD